MRLTELNPEFMNAGGDGVYLADHSPAPLRTGVGLLCDCPCGNRDESHQLYVPFRNPLDGASAIERGWERVGETFDTLTLKPSIRRVGGCAWHGWITNGDVTTV